MLDTLPTNLLGMNDQPMEEGYSTAVAVTATQMTIFIERDFYSFTQEKVQQLTKKCLN